MKKLVYVILIALYTCTSFLQVCAKDTDGKWEDEGYYTFEDGTHPSLEWLEIEGKKYYFDDEGYAKVGWFKLDKKWYYADKTGAQTTGFQKIGKETYYLDENGVMLTGWQKIDNTWYYFKSSGKMTKGWQKVSGKWYYMDTNGKMQTGWQKINGKWYLLAKSGRMLTGWQKVKNTWYYMDASGAMQTGWLKLGKKWYYLKPSGAMVNDRITIKKKTYFFESNGKWLDFNNTNDKYIIANKKHSLSSNYVPNNLVTPNVINRGGLTMTSEAASALEKMFAAAKKDGVTLVGGSGYRSYATQASTYNYWVSVHGKSTADTISARPGYSEHQTGLAIDISDASGATYLSQAFENTAEGKWLKDHAYEYGFVLRYLKGKEYITGYAYEPWHYRYIGKEYAKKIYNNGNVYTLEEYFKVSGGDY